MATGMVLIYFLWALSFAGFLVVFFVCAFPERGSWWKWLFFQRVPHLNFVHSPGAVCEIVLRHKTQSGRLFILIAKKYIFTQIFKGTVLLFFVGTDFDRSKICKFSLNKKWEPCLHSKDLGSTNYTYNSTWSCKSTWHWIVNQPSLRQK